MKDNRPALYYVVDDPKEAERFMKFDSSIPRVFDQMLASYR